MCQIQMTQNCINGTFTYLFGVTLLIIRILAPKMKKWGQDPNNEQCRYRYRYTAHYCDNRPKSVPKSANV